MRWKVCHSENQGLVGGGILLSTLFFSVFTHTPHCLWCFLEVVFDRRLAPGNCSVLA